MMGATEHAIVISCGQDHLVGIVHPVATPATPATPDAPAAPASRGVVIVVGGPQYRVGSHRQFVLLARALATAGYPVLRFDHRGIGDSGGTFGGFEHINDDIAAAVGAFQAACPDIDEVVLWGLCDAASAILFYAFSDPRVCGVVLANPWVRSETGLAQARLKHYYLHRIADGAFWRKLVGGKVNLAAAGRGLVRALRLTIGRHGFAARQPRRAQSSRGDDSSNFLQRMADGLSQFRGRVLLILSGNDLTAREFDGVANGSVRWREMLDDSRVSQFRLQAADHTFATRAWRDQVAASTVDWLRDW